MEIDSSATMQLSSYSWILLYKKSEIINLLRNSNLMAQNEAKDIKQGLNQFNLSITKAINDRITALERNLHIALTGKEANITNDVNSKTFNMSERIIEIETAMSKGMVRMKDDLASEIAGMTRKMTTFISIKSAEKYSVSLGNTIFSTVDNRITAIDAKIANLTSVIQDFIQVYMNNSKHSKDELKVDNLPKFIIYGVSLMFCIINIVFVVIVYYA
jgi:hypothetical protein